MYFDYNSPDSCLLDFRPVCTPSWRRIHTVFIPRPGSGHRASHPSLRCFDKNAKVIKFDEYLGTPASNIFLRQVFHRLSKE